MTTKHIKMIRESLMMTQEEFAKAVGLSLGSVQGWEQGWIKSIRLKNQRKIIEYCNKVGLKNIKEKVEK